MVDPRLDPRGEDEPGPKPGGGPATGVPRWIRLLGIVLVVAFVALMVVLHLTGTLGAAMHQ